MGTQGTLTLENEFRNAIRSVNARLFNGEDIANVREQILDESIKLISSHTGMRTDYNYRRSPLIHELYEWHRANTVIHNDKMIFDPDDMLKTCDVDDNELALVIGIILSNTRSMEPVESQKTQTILRTFCTANNLKALCRMLDPAHKPIATPPRPGHLQGILTDPELSSEWTYRKYLVRALHLPSLFRDPNTSGLFDIDACEERIGLPFLYLMSRMLLEREIDTTTPPDLETGERKKVNMFLIGYAWMRRSRNAFQDVLRAMVNVAFQDPPHRTPNAAIQVDEHGQPLSQEMQNFYENLKYHSITTLDRMSAVHDSMMEDRPFERLLQLLTYAEMQFENFLSIEHIEDQRIDKQLIPVDDRMSASRINNTPQYVEDLRTQLASEKIDSINEYIRLMLSNLTRIDRQRRNFRMMRDWVGRRPWKTILLHLDTDEPENQWRKRGIRDFNRRNLGGIGKDRPRDYDYDRGYRYNLENDPSGEENMSFHLFGFHPIDHAEFAREVDRLEQFKDCPVCGTEYAPDDAVMILHCDHRAHLKCVFETWDDFDTVLHRCPEQDCTAPLQKLNWQHAGVSPEVYNVWGYHPYKNDDSDATDTRPLRPDASRPITEIYDIPHRDSNARYARLSRAAYAYLMNRPRGNPPLPLGVADYRLRLQRRALATHRRQRWRQHIGREYPF